MWGGGIVIYIVAYLLKASTVESEKQPLLANGSETTFVSRQRLGKQVSGATDNHVIIEVFLEDNWDNKANSTRERVRKRGHWKGAALHSGLERVKLKNLHC
jgi:hypothetical protein